jgi:hypothetical protein
LETTKVLLAGFLGIPHLLTFFRGILFIYLKIIP